MTGQGFTLGQGEICYGCEAPGASGGTSTSGEPAIKLGSVLQFDDIRVGVSNFSMDFDGNSSLDGSIYVSTGGAQLKLGGAFTATVKDRNDAKDVNADGSPNTEAMRADLLFEDGEAVGFIFDVDTLELKFGSNGFLVLGAQDFKLDTTAEGDDTWSPSEKASADVKIGSWQVGGEAQNFYITADGDFKPGHPDKPAAFAVILKLGGADGSNFKWPSFIPIKIKTIGLQWEDIEADPTDFNILLSASVDSIKGAKGLKVTGVIDGIVIDPDLPSRGSSRSSTLPASGSPYPGICSGARLPAA